MKISNKQKGICATVLGIALMAGGAGTFSLWIRDAEIVPGYVHMTIIHK